MQHFLLKNNMADGVGFEPTKELPPCRFSRPVPSTARPPIRYMLYCITKAENRQYL